MDNPRRRRFVAWFKTHYGEDSAEARKKFMSDSTGSGENPLTKGRVTQLFDPKEPFGELAARQLGQRFGLGDDYFLFDRPEFGASPEADQASVEAKALADLRDIFRINPETHSSLLEQLHTIAEGARESDRVLGSRTKKGYVKADRAKEILGKNPPPASPNREKSSKSKTSGFGELQDAEDELRANPKGKR